jgi:outer membrane lipoprotein SlyB
MKRLLGVCAIAFALSLVGCASADTAEKEESSGLWGLNRPQPKITVPPGTSLRVVLQQGLGTDTSTPGAEFTGVLAAPIVIDGKTVLPEGAAVSAAFGSAADRGVRGYRHRCLIGVGASAGCW